MMEPGSCEGMFAIQRRTARKDPVQGAVARYPKIIHERLLFAILHTMVVISAISREGETFGRQDRIPQEVKGLLDIGVVQPRT